jgi:aryl sulfotransferase
MHHSKSWWDYIHLSNIGLFHYADMLADPKAEIGRIAKFLEIDVSNKILENIVEKTSLKAMRNRGKENADESIFKDGAQTFFFKGTNGRWKSVLNEEELTMYRNRRDAVLSKDCARWLELGREALD